MFSSKQSIVSDPEILFGKPRLFGTRISVEQVLQCLAQGWTMQEIMTEFPGVTEDGIQAALIYSLQLVGRTQILEKSYSAETTNA
jgi:uncharacterized protein (DUF433 family)